MVPGWELHLPGRISVFSKKPLILVYYTIFMPFVPFLFLNLGIKKMNPYVFFITKEF